MNCESVRVVLISPRNPLNIGAAARAMSNFGFLQLRLVDAYDVAYREAKSAVNASEVLENSNQYATVADAVADCTLVVGATGLGHRVLQQPLRRLEAAGRILQEAADHERIAILFGSEKFGLSNEDLSHCHWLMRIPTREVHESMNLGQAVAVCLYELIRSEKAETQTPKPAAAASAAQVERVGNMLLESLQLSGYVQDQRAEEAEHMVRRLMLRLRLSGHDAQVWMGMFRQILWKLRQD